MPDIIAHVVIAPPVAFVPVDGMRLPWPVAVQLAETWRRLGEEGDEAALLNGHIPLLAGTTVWLAVHFLLKW